MSINTRLRRVSIALKPAPNIDVHDTITEQPFKITRRGLQRPLIHGCGGLQSPLQTSSDVHFRYGLSAITTRLVSIVNANKVYNNGQYI